MKKKSKPRHEFFEITKIAKKFDRRSGKFHINISYKTATDLTPRTLAVAEAFGLGVDRKREHILYDDVELRISPKDIVYITGESGSGKTVLLKQLQKLLATNTANIKHIRPNQHKPLIDTVGKTLQQGLELLSRVGLNDAFLFVRRYAQLSDGQKYRYRIAKLIEASRQYWIMDEFCSTLDRATAKIVAYNVQKLARTERRAVLAATTHTDLFEDLQPSVHIHKRLGREVEVKYYPNVVNKACSVAKQARIQQGTIQDYKQLAQFHYRESGGLPPPRKVFTLKRRDETIGAIVYSYPPFGCFGRSKIFKKRMKAKELNETLSIISRVVLHPKYRTIGLGTRLVKETLPQAGTPYVEAVAVMARYNPFFEKAGMEKIAEQIPDVSCVEAVEKLRRLGFNPVLLASENHNLRQLRKMSVEDVRRCREVLAAVRSPRLRRAAVPGQPYSRDDVYQRAVMEAEVEKIARMLRVLSILMQTKVYLFWRKSDSA